jgi:hypothetical protein
MPDDIENPEIKDGPGGVATPTPEPGGTPTPQDEPLKPLADLLGGKAAEPAAKTPEELAAEAAAATKPKPDAAAERIRALTAEKWNLRREAEANAARAKLAEDTIAELQKLGVQASVDGTATPPAKPTAPAPKTFTQAEVNAEAARIAEQTSFNRSVDAAVIAGRAAHPDYDEAIAGLKSMTGPIVPQELIVAALQTGEASEVIYHLGKNSDVADRILSLPPIPQAVAVAQLASELKATRGDAPVASRAPKPIPQRVTGRGVTDDNLETMSMADFIKKRNETERAAAAERRR